MRNIDITAEAVKDFKVWCESEKQGMKDGFLLNLGVAIEEYLEDVGYYVEN